MAKPPKYTPPPEFDLTRLQNKVFELIEGTKQNIALMGKPGVGKSVLIRSLDNNGSKKYYKAAPTGLAAINVDGKTVHSMFGIPTSEGIIEETYNVFSVSIDNEKFIKYQVKHLIIDEISMVRCDQLDYIDRCLQQIKGKKLPFGGIQVIVVGDFFQLPPVTKPFELRQLYRAGYRSPFAFDAKVWKTFQVVELTEILRQKNDKQFIRLLHEARLGNVSAKLMVELNKQVHANSHQLKPSLTATNWEADKINYKELDDIDETNFTFVANEFGKWLEMPVDKEVEVKIGAQVMVRKNGADIPPGRETRVTSKVVNGTMGVVVDIHQKLGEDSTVDHVTIRDMKGNVHKIYTQRWERKVKEQDATGHWEEKVIASYEQMPIMLAWAMSMHKSQGQTFDFVHINADRVRMAGQLYVALSRCKTLKGVSLESRIHRDRFMVDKDVLRFNKTITAK